MILDRNELAKLAAALGGLPVLACRPSSPADRAGVRYGDIVLSVNGIRTPDWTKFVEARNRDRDRMVLELFRDGVELIAEVDLTSGRGPVDAPTLLAEILSEHIFPLDEPAPPDDKN